MINAVRVSAAYKCLFTGEPLEIEIEENGAFALHTGVQREAKHCGHGESLRLTKNRMNGKLVGVLLEDDQQRDGNHQ